MKAYELLADEASWTKGTFRYTTSERTMYCLAGAIDKCYPQYNAYTEVRSRVCEAIRKHYGDEYVTLTGFNDDFRTKHADVIAVLKEADA